MKASVIILAYNSAATIREALDSVLAQDASFPFEIVVADDGSADDTRAICEDYAGRFPQKIRLLPAAPNKGIVDNYFDALLDCRGEYIADCAGDDIWVDTARLRRQVEWLDNRPDCDAVISDWKIASPEGSQLSSDMPQYQPFRREIHPPEMARLVLGSISAMPFLSAMLMRREPILRILNENPRSIRRKEWGAEDFPLLASLGVFAKFGYLPLIASEYHITPGSITHARAGRLFDFYADAADGVMDLIGIHGFNLSEFSNAISARLNYLSTLLISDFTAERGERYSKLVKRTNPVLPLKTRLYGKILHHRIPRAVIKSLKRIK